MLYFHLDKGHVGFITHVGNKCGHLLPEEHFHMNTETQWYLGVLTLPCPRSFKSTLTVATFFFLACLSPRH